MTTIAFRNGIMAADTSTYIHEGNLRMPSDRSTKLRRLSDGSVVGAAGVRRQISDFVAWYEKGQDGPRPSIDLATIIHCFPDGRVSVYDGSYDERDVTNCEFYACGSGAMAALAAMSMGASAEQAVKVAMLYDPWTGGEVQTEKVY